MLFKELFRVLIHSPQEAPPFIYVTSDLDKSDPELKGQNTASPMEKFFVLDYIVHDPGGIYIL